jgi:hypothetical protein
MQKNYCRLKVLQTHLNAEKLQAFKPVALKLNMIQASGLFKPQNELGETIIFLTSWNYENN